MNNEQIIQKRQEIIGRFGEWTAHNIHLKNDIYTFDQDHPKFQDQLTRHGAHLRRIIQTVSDVTRQPLNTLRVLDLACLEGLYGIEFARHGAEVIAIEGREANIEKARFAKDVLELDNITFVQDDVRNLSAEKYGHFDVVLCLGILYHLDAPDVFCFVDRISEVCRHVTIIDTHMGIVPNERHTFAGQEYQGSSYIEHSPTTTTDDRLKSLWASLDNEKSFWFTRPSLWNLLSHAGFTSVHTCQNPAFPWQMPDRDTLVALKGERRALFSTPSLNSLPDDLWPEDSKVGFYPTQPAPAAEHGQQGNSSKFFDFIKRFKPKK